MGGGGSDPRSPPLDPRMTLTHFTARSVLETEAFKVGKSENYGFF